MNSHESLTRRNFCSALCGAGALSLSSAKLFAETQFDFKYILGSCMYGYSDLNEIVPEVSKVGASAIDIWPKVHGNQREQLDEMGEEKFAELLKSHNVSLGCITQYKLGPFGLREEIFLEMNSRRQSVNLSSR